MINEIKFYKETDFKETPIGKIPKDWGVVRLKDACIKIKAGGTPLTSKKEFYDGDIPFVKIEDITNAQKYLKSTSTTITKAGLENSSAWLVPSKSLLFAMYGSLGAIAINEVPLATNQAILAIVPYKEKIDLEFLYYLLIFLKPYLQKHAKQTTQANLTAEIVKEFKIPLPSLEEQQKIAEILSTVDDAIQKTNEVIAKTERLKKGLMQELLTKGIGHKEFKDTEIGKIPKEWKVVRLEEVSKGFISGGTPPTKEPKFWGGDIPWIRSVHIAKYYIDYSSIEHYITMEGLKNSAANIVPRNNLIVATRVGIGKSAVNLIDVAINQDLTGIVLDKSKVDPVFIVWYLHSPKVIKFFESFSRGTTIKGIPQSSLRNLPIPLPSLDEQQKIAEILSTVDKRLELERNEKVRLERIKQGLMDLLLTGKIRVKVN